MRLLVATDAWHPQVNGVVRSLEQMCRALAPLGVEAEFVTPRDFRTVPLPSYPEIRLAMATAAEIGRRLDETGCGALHIATEGPIGLAARRHCLRQGLAFSTSYHTRFPEYLRARAPVPIDWTYAWLRRFHAAAAVTMVSTDTLRQELAGRGFRHLKLWTRGVDAELFRPRAAPVFDHLPRPIFLSVGRLAVEKNLAVFLALDLPGTKVVVGDGPARADLQRRFPEAVFLGGLEGEALAASFASADVFVFPSRTDTYGIVLLEALASGLPVAAFPVPGPCDVIGQASVGVMDEDLRAAALRALTLSRKACRAFALERSWENSARQFLGNIAPLRSRDEAKPHPIGRADGRTA